MLVTKRVTVTSGVPQGSVLGPYLFSVVLGSFEPLCPKSLFMYADDVTFCFPLFEGQNNNHVTEEHSHFLKWCNEVDLRVNVNKCKSITFRKRSDCCPVYLPHIENVKSLKLLGVIFEEKLSWKPHFDHVILSASRRLYALRGLCGFIGKKQMKIVYFAIVRSVLEYSNPLFLNISVKDRNRLDRLQKRFHRLICGSCCNSDCLQPLGERRTSQAMKLFKAALSPSHILHVLLPPQSRRSRRFLLNFTSTERGRKSFINLCASTSVCTMPHCKFAVLLHCKTTLFPCCVI